ncbi:MAG: TIGR01212 family radical SAM protein [Anaerovoracaceae bacterium]
MFKDGARYNGIGPWLKESFGQRIVKLSIDGGFTCPNRDGTLSSEGCIFCSERGSGDFAGDRSASITEQMDAQIRILSGKWKEFRCLAYFQNYTNTYAPAAVLREKYEEALRHPLCCGLAIATRPDCISPEVLQLLSELNQKTFLWVELGLQTARDDTARAINRCCSTAVYDDTVRRLTGAGIRVVTHIIFGLPGETPQDMLQTVQHVCSAPIFGIKLHLLHIMKGTALGHAFLHPAPFQPPFAVPMEKETYIKTAADALELIPPEITIHRLTGDAPRQLLLAPLWSLDKKSVLNEIRRELKKRGTCQGSRAENDNL